MGLDYCTELVENVVCIDTGYGRKGMVAAYLIRERERAAIIDSGTYDCVPRFLEILDYYGIALANVDYVIPTHVHLDHAGGAGELIRQLPNARLVVHPRGAPHLIDPTRLIAGTSVVYGDDGFRERFGEVVPVPVDRIITAPDTFTLNLEERALVFIDSPGHARHHFCIYDAKSEGIFAGDTFGVSFREFDTDSGAFVFATTTPPQFDPDAWFATLDRLLSYNPRRIYVAHFGCVENVPKLADQLRDSIRTFADMALALANMDDRKRQIEERMLSDLIRGLRDHGCTLPRQTLEALLAMDVDLNAQGLDVWIKRHAKPAHTSRSE